MAITAPFAPPVPIKDWEDRTSVMLDYDEIAAPSRTIVGRTATIGRTIQRWNDSQKQQARTFLQSIATYFDLSWLGFMRYLVEPSELRDHFMTTCMVGLCLNLGLDDSPEVVKGVSEAVTSTSLLTEWFPAAKIFSPSSDSRQCYVLRQLDDGQKDNLVLYRDTVNRLEQLQIQVVVTTPGFKAKAAVEHWRSKETRQRLAHYPTVMDIALIDRLWLEGWDIARMPSRVADLLGRQPDAFKSVMKRMAKRWIVVEGGMRAVDDYLGLCDIRAESEEI